MDMDDVDEDIEEITFSYEGTARITVLAERVAALSPGEVGRAEYLNTLGQYLELEGNIEEARDAFKEALADGGETFFHPLTRLHDLERESGRVERADELLAELLVCSRADQLADADYGTIGECLEEAGELKKALRWFTIPLSDVDPDDLDGLDIVCLNGRSRVRARLDLPPDRYEDARLALVLEYAAEHPG